VRIGHHDSQDPVYGITTAEDSHTDDISRRQKQYILTMLIRVVSIVVVVSVPGISWQIKILLCLVATIIPYIAVVRANGGPTPPKDPTNLLVAPPEKQALGWEQPGLPGSGRVVDGEAETATEADEAPDPAWDGGADGADGAEGADEVSVTGEMIDAPDAFGTPGVFGTAEANEAAETVEQRGEPEPVSRSARASQRG
jgi:DUF3099 family protein